MSGQSVRLKTFSISSPTWYPSTQSVSGTSSSTNVLVTGLGTKYLSEISEGDWFINASNEAHKVFRIASDTQLELYDAFTIDLAGATVQKIKDKAIKYLKAVFITNSGTVTGVTQTTGGTWPASIPWESPSYDDFIEPILITPGGGGASIIQGE